MASVYKMMFFCCCAKPRKDEASTLPGIESKSNNLSRILLEFVSEESKLGLKDIHCIDMIEKVIEASSSKGEIPKKDLIKIYKSNQEAVNQKVLQNFLVQEFFFTDNLRHKYDFNKVVLFNLLYTGGSETEKANMLFNVVENTTSNCVHNHSNKLITTLEHLAYIPCIAVGENLNSARRFQTDDDDLEFQELLSLFSTNSNMLHEFALHIINACLFPSMDEKQYLNRTDFQAKLQTCGYLLVKPNELRKKYTEYVLQNR